MLGNKSLFSYTENPLIKVDGVALDLKVNKEQNIGILPIKIAYGGAEIHTGLSHMAIKNNAQQTNYARVDFVYTDTFDEIQSAGNGIHVNKKLYKKVGEEWKSLNGDKLKLGDECLIQLIIKVDEDMDYVFLKDLRAASFEPKEVLSGYQYEGGLWYYKNIKDASMQYFFEHLNSGTYVLEYKVVANHKGNFTNGNASIECMYAPEFVGHSESEQLVVE